jgi:hypothetical protein
MSGGASRGHGAAAKELATIGANPGATWPGMMPPVSPNASNGSVPTVGTVCVLVIADGTGPIGRFAAGTGGWNHPSAGVGIADHIGTTDPKSVSAI